MRASYIFGLLVLIVSYCVFYAVAVPILADPDMPWHLAAGDIIRAEGKIPALNIWSFSAAEQPWYLLSWGWNIVLSLIHEMAGLKTLFVMSLGFCAFLMAMLASKLAAQNNVSTDVLLLTISLVTLSLMEFASARPQIMGYFFVLVFYWLLHESRAQPQSKKIFALPLLMLAWVNVHGSFFVGFTLIGAYGLEALMMRRWQWFKHLAVIGIACVAVLPLNPYGLQLYDGVLGTLASSGLSYITEWKHFSFGQSMGISAYITVFALALFYRDKKAPLADMLLSVMWFFAALWSTRNTAIFVLVSAPYFARNLQSALFALEHIRTHHPDPLNFLKRTNATSVLVLISASVFVGSYSFIDVIKGDRYLVSEEKDTGAAIAYLRENLQGKHVLNDYDMGGRIIYESKGEFPVFIDSRLGTAYPDALIADYLRFLYLEEGWEEMLAAYRIDAMLIANNVQFAKAYEAGEFRDTWKQVYKDTAASIYLKK